MSPPGGTARLRSAGGDYRHFTTANMWLGRVCKRVRAQMFEGVHAPRCDK